MSLPPAALIASGPSVPVIVSSASVPVFDGTNAPWQDADLISTAPMSVPSEAPLFGIE